MREADRHADAWKLLIGDLRRGDCVPFLGAGVSVKRLPLGGKLAAKWHAKVECPLDESASLSSVMQYAATITYRDPNRLKREFVEEEGFANVQPPDPQSDYPVHSLLAQLDLPLYVTTNYDDFMYLALRQERGKNPSWALCPWYSDDPEEVPDSPFHDPHYVPTPSSPLVFHLHGHHSEPRSLVLTDDDYIDFMVRLADDASPRSLARAQPLAMLPGPIRLRLRKSPLLFLGYSLSDWNFLVLFRTLMKGLSHGQRREHVSVQIDPDERISPERRRFFDQYCADQRIRVLWESPESFTAHLRSALEVA
ncbi:SIR2 family protein [Nonomuraea sp. NPDC050310]|uniref:SIR2 family NAD-dependent protein deacylase n=1 Tax=Nonomuraea sp. NPDC050310 TaxID=3154935 RepID=UPI0033EA5E4F